MQSLTMSAPRKPFDWNCSHANSPRSCRELSGCLCCAGLPGFLLQPLARNSNSLLLVRVGRAQVAQVCSHLPHLILVRAAYGHVSLLLDRDLNPLRDWKLDGMREPERKHHVFALDLSAISHSHDIEIFLEAGGDAENRICHQRPGQPVQRA